MQITKSNYYILTGAMGGGKSTILKQLSTAGMKVVDEPARKILAEQRCIGGEGVPDKSLQLFADLLLSRALFQYEQLQNYEGPVVFDRGIADNIGYAALFGLDTEIAMKAAEVYRYNPLVFVTHGWEEIYKTDDERKMSFLDANQFGLDIKDIYKKLGYRCIDVPLESAQARAEFILNMIKVDIG